MSWVSFNKLNTLCTGLRNKFTTNELVLANSDKTKGAHLNVGGQDGLITMSPMTEDGSTPAALWVTDSEANNATELTGGTLSYVTGVGTDSEDYTSLSLVGDVVNVSGKNGAQRRITNVADPVSDNDAVNQKTLLDPPLLIYTPNIIQGGTISNYTEITLLDWVQEFYLPNVAIEFNEDGFYYVRLSANISWGDDQATVAYYNKCMLRIGLYNNITKQAYGLMSVAMPPSNGIGNGSAHYYPITVFSQILYLPKASYSIYLQMKGVDLYTDKTKIPIYDTNYNISYFKVTNNPQTNSNALNPFDNPYIIEEM